MRLQVVFVLAAVLAVSAALEPTKVFDDWVEPSFLQVETDAPPNAANIGYVPDSVAFDNPGTLSKRINTIPTYPDCTVRPQTVVEIHRMRRNAARIAQMIQTEVSIMEKRKTYVEQMTSYLNDRIRELNKVKGELEQENRWIEVSNQKIAELAQNEKLIKMQDILACLNQDQDRRAGAKATQMKEITEMQTHAKDIMKNIATIRANIKAVNEGKKAGGG